MDFIGVFLFRVDWKKRVVVQDCVAQQGLLYIPNWIEVVCLEGIAGSLNFIIAVRHLMDYFFGIIVVATCLWVFAVFRGRKAVRAYMYLRFLDHGQSSSEANAAAICIGFLEAGKHQTNARQFVCMQFDGKQLAMIASARSLGFKG